MEFGTTVVVTAEVMRVKKGWDGSLYYQAGRLQDNRQRRMFTGGEWPGEPIDGKDEERQVKVRRLLKPVPEVGVVVGRTNIQEGNIEGGGFEENRYWVPYRAFPVLQIAVRSDSKARIITALEQDVKAVDG